MYYSLDNLFLEITRMCTLECEHCLRGKRENQYIDKETIDNVFAGVVDMRLLLLSGGEPLLPKCVERIKWVTEAIKRNHTKIYNGVCIITNGTPVLNEDTMNALKELKELLEKMGSELIIEVSNDVFHQLQIDKLKLRERQGKNISLLQQSGFNVSIHNFGERTSDKLYPMGRAANLTPERLDEINKQSPTKYSINRNWKYPFHRMPVYRNGYIWGDLPIDINGNVTGLDLSFELEDEIAKRGVFNVNEVGLAEAVKNCEAFFQELRTGEKAMESLIK